MAASKHEVSPNMWGNPCAPWKRK